MGKQGATSIQRIFAIVTALALVSGFLTLYYISEFNNAGETFIRNYTDASEENFRNYLEQLNESRTSTDSVILNQPYGDEVVGGKAVTEILTGESQGGWNFIKGIGYQGEDALQSYFIQWFVIFMGFCLVTIIILEAFMILYSKKHT